METSCYFDWGPVGVSRAVEKGRAIIIVDTLSFSTCVAGAVEKGGIIFPCAEKDMLMPLAAEMAAEWSVSRKEVPAEGRFSLSPLTYQQIKAGDRVVLFSPNGGNCSRLAANAPFAFTGALVNAEYLAIKVNEIAQKKKIDVSVIACGEQLKTDITDNIRWAIEDYLGAGAIISYLRCRKTLEAQLCESVYIRNRERLNVILLECESGKELSGLGFRNDILFSAQLNICRAAPILDQNCFVNYR